MPSVAFLCNYSCVMLLFLFLILLLFLCRGVYGHTTGDLPWECCEDFSVSPTANLIGMVIIFTTVINSCNHVQCKFGLELMSLINSLVCLLELYFKD